MRSPMKKAFVLALVSSMLALGCELIVDFDRTKIVGEEVPETGTSETGPIDSSTIDTGSDAPADTGQQQDAANDAADAAADG